MPFMDKHLGFQPQSRTLLPHGVGLRDKYFINGITYGIGAYWGVDDRVYRFNSDLSSDGFLNTPTYPSYGLKNMQACPTQNYLIWSRFENSKVLVELYDTKLRTVRLTREFVAGHNTGGFPLGVFTNGDFVVHNHYTGELIMHDKNGNVIASNPLATGVSQDPFVSAYMIVSSKRNIVAVLETDTGVRKLTLFDRKLNYLHHYQFESWWFNSTHRLCDITENGDLVMTYGDYNTALSTVSLVGIDYYTKKITGLKTQKSDEYGYVWKRYVGTYKNEIYYVIYFAGTTKDKILYVVNATTLAPIRQVNLIDSGRFSIIDVDDKYFYSLYYPFADGEQARFKVFPKTMTSINTALDNDGSIITFPSKTTQVFYKDSINGPLHHGKGSWESFGKYWR